MLPTPDTSHVPYSRVYEPSEDSFLLLDTLSSDTERAFLQSRFARSPAPLVVELGTGSGVVLAFASAHAQTIFGTRHLLTAGVDMNAFACRATVATVAKACREHGGDSHGVFLGVCMGDLGAPWRAAAVDVLVFNPPYVPTPEMPVRPGGFDDRASETTWDGDSYLLGLAYAGGRHGMETTARLLPMLPDLLAPRGCAYLLLCAQNRPDDVRATVCAFGPEWRAEAVSSTGKTAGWEKLQVLRIWRHLAVGEEG